MDPAGPVVVDKIHSLIDIPYCHRYGDLPVACGPPADLLSVG